MFGLALHAEPQALIGTCGLWRLDAENHRAELGYMLAQAHWGRGLIGEAISAVCRHGFEQLHLHSIEAHVDPANAASVRVLERAGFVREGYFASACAFAAASSTTPCTRCSRRPRRSSHLERHPGAPQPLDQRHPHARCPPCARRPGRAARHARGTAPTRRASRAVAA